VISGKSASAARSINLAGKFQFLNCNAKNENWEMVFKSIVKINLVWFSKAPVEIPPGFFYESQTSVLVIEKRFSVLITNSN